MPGGLRRHVPHVLAQRVDAIGEQLEVLPGQDERGAGGGGAGGVLPDRRLVDEGVLAEVGAVGDSPEDGVLAVGARADLVDAAVGEQEHLVAGAAEGGQLLAGLEVDLPEALGEFAEDVEVLVVAQQAELTELGRDHLDPGPGLDELHASVADRVAQPSG